MSLNFVEFLEELEIINEGVPSFVGERYYMATGDLSNEDTHELESVSYQNKPSRAALTAKPGDVIFARMKGTNKVLLITEKERSYIFSTGFVVLRSSEKVDESYLTHYLKSSLFQDEKDKLCTGATQKAINNQNIEKLKFPLPPLATQKRIAEILDAADALRRKDQELLKKYDELAQAIFIDMFGDPVKNEKGWEVKKGSDVIKVLGGAAFKSTDYTETGIPLIRIGTINKGYFDKSQIVFLPIEFALTYERYIIKPKDLLITLTGTVGKDDYGNVFVIDESYDQYLLNQRVAKLIVREDVLKTRFFEFLLKQKEIKAELTGVSRGVRQANISNGDIYNLDVISPPIELQNDFVQRINNLYIQIETSSNNSIVSNVLFSSLIQKAFSDELVA